MRKLFVAVVVALGTFISFPTVTSAQSTGNVRLLLHSTRQISNGGSFSWGGWVIAPNITAVPNKWLVLTGPRLQGRDWWSEFNLGAFVQGGKITPTIDVRTSWPFPRPLSFWTNLQWVNPAKVYAYGEVDYQIPGGFVIGLETENNFPVKSFGPHLKFPFGEAVVQAIYQFHDGEDQLWFRLVVNFR